MYRVTYNGELLKSLDFDTMLYSDYLNFIRAIESPLGVPYLPYDTADVTVLRYDSAFYQILTRPVLMDDEQTVMTSLAEKWETLTMNMDITTTLTLGMQEELLDKNGYVLPEECYCFSGVRGETGEAMQLESASARIEAKVSHSELINIFASFPENRTTSSVTSSTPRLA